MGETHKTSGSEDLMLAERETKVAEKKQANLSKELTPEKDETKVAQALANGEIEAHGPEDSKPTETETKLVQKKQHRSMKKATRKREEKEIANIPTNEHPVAGPKDLTPAEKEPKVKEKNLHNLTKEEAAPQKEDKKDVETPTIEDSVGMVKPSAEEKSFGAEDSIQAELGAE